MSKTTDTINDFAAVVAERDRYKVALENLLGALSVWRPVQPPPDPTDCTSGYPQFIRKSWFAAVDALDEGRVDAHTEGDG